MTGLAFLLAHASDGSVEILDLERDTSVRRLKPGIGDMLSVAFSPDRRWLTAGGHSSAGVWDAATGRLRHAIKGPENSSATHVAFLPDGRWTVTGGVGPLRFWNVETGVLVCTFVACHEGGWAVDAVEFSAHAFNSDGVKSVTARRVYRIRSPRPPVKGTAFDVSVGVNAYDDPELDLRFATNDARRARTLLVESLGKTGGFEITGCGSAFDDGFVRQKAVRREKAKS